MAEQTNHRATRHGTAFILILCTLVLGLHAFTLRPGHTWWGMDDFTAYLAHGRNLVQGLPYSDIDSVHDSNLPASNQRTAFPPAFSLVVGVVDFFTRGDHLERSQGTPVLARSAAGLETDLETHLETDLETTPATEQSAPPGTEPTVVQRLPYGVDILAIKRVLAFFTALAVFMIYRAFRFSARPPVLFLAVAAFALSPYVFAFRELVRSEMMFLGLTYLWLAQVQSIGQREEEGERADGTSEPRKTWGAAVLAGLVMAAAYSTRTAAIVLPAALVAIDVLRYRRLRSSSVVMLGVAALCVLLLRMGFDSVEGGYVNKMATEWSFSTMTFNAEQLVWNFERLWANGFSGAVQRGVGAIMVLLAVIGFVLRLCRPGIIETYAMAYMGMILVLPTDSAWMRYLLPLLPVFFLYAFTGAQLIAGEAIRRRRLVLGAVVLMLAANAATAFANLDRGPLADGLSDPETEQVFQWVRENTEPYDVVVFKKSRALTQVTGRPSLCYPEVFKYGELSQEQVWDHFRAVKPVALILKHSPVEPSNIFNMLSHTDQGFLESFVAHSPDELVEVLRNDDFSVYELRAFPDQG